MDEMYNELDEKLSNYTDSLLERADRYRNEGKTELSHEVMRILNEILMIQGVI